MRLRLLLLSMAIFLGGSSDVRADDWPQFRGPGGRAVSETATPPIGFGQASNLVWKVAVPSGNSSPIVTGGRIFLTAVKDGRLEILCLDRMDGGVLWRRQAPLDGLKPWDRMTPGPATPTPVSDGNSVYVFFGSFGLIAYDLDGKEQWRQPFVTPDLEASASPILIDDSLILFCDQDRGSYIERPQFGRSHATPFHWVHGKGDELVVPGSISLTSYDPLTGKENWHYTGTSRVATSSPTADGNLLFFSSSNIGDNDSFSASPNVGNAKDSGFSTAPFVDFDSLIKIERPKAGNGVLAIQSCGRGDITKSHLAWKSTRSLPYAASPLFYKGRLFTIKAGGLVSAYDAKSGRPIYQDERLNTPGDYYASPVAAADRIYFMSGQGTITVINATTDIPAILDQHKLGEQTTATPALHGHTIIVRNGTTPYSFGTTRQPPGHPANLSL